MISYLHGVDEVLGAAAAPGRGVLITVRDVPALIQAQGGNAGTLLDRFLPDTLEATVYTKMAAEIAAGMKDKGVSADVRVVTPVGYKPAPSPDFTRGALVGAGAVGVGWIAWKLIRGLF